MGERENKGNDHTLLTASYIRSKREREREREKERENKGNSHM